MIHRIQYNSPVILTYTFLAAAVLAISNVSPDFKNLFVVFPTMDFTSFVSYFRLFSHALGHDNWQHFAGNFSFILILGPILEEKYGSKSLLLMIFVTALVTGIFNVVLFSTGLMGASGVVFMLILLASFTNMQAGKIPITFLLILFVYLGGEVYSAFQENKISEFAHIMGGICGSVFGYVFRKPHDKLGNKKTPTPIDNSDFLDVNPPA